MDKVVAFLTEKQFLGNEYWRFALLLLMVFIGMAVGRILRYFVERAGERLQRDDAKTLPGVICACLGRPLTLIGLCVGLNLGLACLNLTENLQEWANRSVWVLAAITVGYTLYRLVEILDHYLTNWAAKTPSKLDDMLVPLVRKSLRITIVIIVTMFIIEQVAGRDKITTLLAGLGVGGLAVALAAQDTIKNFFGSLMILLDKPFQIGERIMLGGHDGPVEEVGFRSTKIRTLDGHLVTVPNSTVVNEMVQNIGRRPFIKRVMNVTITYDTSKEKVERAIEILKDILDNHEGMNPEFPPRVFFNEMNSDSLNLLVIYWYHPPEYWDFLAFSEKVNLAILDRFNAEGIDFAFPTQTLYLANDEKRQLAVRLLNENSQTPQA